MNTVRSTVTLAVVVATTAAVVCLDQAAAYDIVNRWTATQFDGGGIQRGDSVTLYWSIVPDGESYERASNSQVIVFLDNAWNVPQQDRTPTLTARPWWDAINAAYQQYNRISGLQMIYRPEQNALGQDTGMQGDIRIGGEAFDTNPNVNVLADNTFPNGGDMRIDTTPDSFYSSGIGITNLVAHESGHGVGLGHTSPEGAESVMEGGIQTHFFGMQFDDVYALNRLYGDPREKNGGNDTLASSLSLGTLSAGASVSLGTHADDTVVEEFDGDWLGIDGSSDEDWFRFHLPNPSVAEVRVTPRGPDYRFDGADFNAAAQSNLRFEVYKSDGSLLHSVDSGGLGDAEIMPAQQLLAAGDYHVRVLGSEDKNQFYQLDIAAEQPELVLTVNRDTGEMTMSGLSAAGVDIDGYRIESPSGSLDPADSAWLSLQDQGVLDWQEANPTASSVQELLPNGAARLTDADSLHLGSFYSQVLTAPLGTPEVGDVTFSYLTEGSDGEWVKGAIEFTGAPFANNLVLTVDPQTGEAVLTNESGATVLIDGYSIASDSASLDTQGWSSLGDQALDDWREANPTDELLTEFKPTGASALAPGDWLGLGNLLDVSGEQDLEFTFLLPGDKQFRPGVVVYELIASPGDYDRDGDVDADDFAVWLESYGSTQNLAADGNRDGVVDSIDYAVWRENLTPSAQTTTSTPEPGMASLALLAVVVGGALRRRAGLLPA